MLCISELTHSHFGGFLLRRGWFRPSLAIQTRALLSTGGNAVSPRQDIHCADYIGVVFVTTAYGLLPDRSRDTSGSCCAAAPRLLDAEDRADESQSVSDARRSSSRYC